MDEGAEQAGPAATRPPVVRDWRWALGLVGRVFITLGLLILAFVAYQLWGTGIEFRSNQRELAKDFREAQASIVGALPTTAAPPPTTLPAPTTTPAPGATAAPSTVPPTTGATPTTQPVPTFPELELGDVIGSLTLPDDVSGTTYYLVTGVRVEDLKRGVGHYPSTPLPGEFGNAALAGHRTTYGAPFEHLDRLAKNDRITVDTITGGHYEYVVTADPFIVKPTDTWVLGQPADSSMATLTLTTCHPKRSTKQRLIVQAVLDPAASTAPVTRQVPSPPTTTSPATAPTTIPGTTLPGTPTSAVPPTTTPPPSTVPATLPDESLAGDGQDVDERDADDLARGWFHDSGAWPHIVGWGLLLIGISVGGWYLGRRVGRRWVGYAAGFAPFVVVLYFFFQNVNRLLPPGL